MVLTWQSRKKFPTSVTQHAQSQPSPKLTGCLAEVSSPVDASSIMIAFPLVALGSLFCWLISPEAISICQGNFSNREKQKWKGKVLTAYSQVAAGSL